MSDEQPVTNSKGPAPAAVNYEVLLKAFESQVASLVQSLKGLDGAPVPVKQKAADLVAQQPWAPVFTQWQIDYFPVE
ncbi:hypothetical protein ACFXPI_12220 [Streptomyces sp. NPDC059104]|uniref:hypothetical protein n=1 Tax=Streptomyces sp. NPDC059104 TaxID=3346729 RepID=UPI00368BEAC7